MIKWYRKHRAKALLAVLNTTKEFVIESTEEGWSDISPVETTLQIDELIAYIINPDKNIFPEEGNVLYAPTGSVQEIAIANGWHDDYLSLAERYDSLEYLIKRK